MVEDESSITEPPGAQSVTFAAAAPIPVEAFGQGGDADVLEQARALYAVEKGKERALEWAGDFENSELYQCASRTDISRLHPQESLLSLVKRSQSEHTESRFSESRLDRFNGLFPELQGDEEFQSLLRVARFTLVGGIRLESDPAMPRNCTPRPLSATQLPMEKAICRLACESWQQGGSLIFSVADFLLLAAQSEGKCHLSLCGWAPKYQKDKGRLTCDPRSLNNLPSRKEVQELMRKKYGRIDNVTIGQIVQRLIRLEDQLRDGTVPPELAVDLALVLFKTDLEGAFTLLDLHPESALLQCYVIGLDLIAVSLRGNFGTVELPFAFFVLSSLLEKAGLALGRRVGTNSALGVYVDDTCGGALVSRDDWASEIRKRVLEPLHSAYCILLGDSSVNLDGKKIEFGFTLDFLGWRVDAEARTVRLSDKSLLKLIYYLSLVVENKAKGTTLEVVASLAERMSAVVPLLRVFLPALYHQYVYLDCKDATVTLQGNATTAVSILRELAYAEFRLPAFSFDVLRPRVANWHVQFDGSNRGVGAVVSRRENGAWVMKGQISLALPSLLSIDESLRDKVQNGCELLSVVVGLLAIAVVDSAASIGVAITGDSAVVALHWLKEKRFRGEPGMRAALAVILLEHRRDLRVVDHGWVPASENMHCDGLSRLKGIPLHPGTWTVSDTECPAKLTPVKRFVDLCNPWAALQGPLDSAARLESFLSELAPVLPMRV